MTSDPTQHSSEKIPPRDNSFATFIAVCLAAAWLVKRGIEYLQNRYPNTPLLEALDQVLNDNDVPNTAASHSTTTPQPVVPPVNEQAPISAEMPPPVARITPPSTESESRAEFNPSIPPLMETLPEPVTEPEPQAPVAHKPGTIFALLVGIDRYPRGIRSLRGCVNDIKNFKQYLEERAKKDGNESLLQVKMLTNAQATREAIIDGWCSHLGQAGPEDVALFYYSGHGAQSRAPFEFHKLEPDNKLESLVCYDSRTKNWDLTDQELGQLIAEVDKKHPHIVTILDCCNSGTITRAIEGDAVVRQVPIDPRNRPFDTFLVNPILRNEQGQVEKLQRGRHVVLSACQAFELAQEKRIAGQRRGVFSYYLLDSLQRSEIPATYRDLFKRVGALVRANSTRQSPMIEATVSADLDLPFLGGKTEQGKPYFTLSHGAEDGWVIDGGAVHGIKPQQQGMTTWLSLFPNTTDNDNLLDIAQVIGYAKVGSVFPGSSAVQVRLNDGNMLDKGETYKAVVSAVPLQPLGVSFEGDEAALQPIRDALKTAGVGGAPSMFVSESSEQFDLRLIVKEDAYRIQSADDAYNLVIDTDLDSAESPQLVVTRLEHIARWQTMLNLQNSSSRLPDDAVSLVVESRDTDANSDKTPDLKLNYLQDSRGHWQKPQIRIRVTNHSDQKLYCSIVALSKAYGIMPVRSDWVEPGDSFERTGRSSVPDAYRGAGFTTTQDVYKLFVSTDELDMTLAGQDELPAELVNARSSVSVPLNRLDALLPQFGTRMFEADDEDELPLRDWLSKTVTVTTSRPQLGRSLNPDEAGKAQRLNSVVSVMAHSGMRAKARLSTLEAATRDLQSSRRGVIPPIFREDGVAAHPLDLMGEMASRSGRSELNVLELYDIENQAAVTAENPLEIHIDGAFSAGDALLPLSYDDEFYLPLGLTEVTETGCVVRLHRLPEPLAEATRSVTGSIRILFQKLLSNYIAIEYNYPRLAIAKLSAETDTVRYESNEILVQQAVAEASNVLLYVHGIFDDTGLLASSTSAEIAEAFDLILTFDYENLDSSIRRNGKELFDKLQGVGFNAEDGKDLTIVAHSMGGLVSRSMIEQWGGNQFVSHLMTLGTPHEGSPWAKIEDLALVTLTTVLNGMTDIPWPLRAVLSLVQAIEKFDTNLDDMQVGSNFLEELNASLDPNVRYTIISGDTSLIPNALADADPKPSRFRRMLNALKSRRLQHQLATLVGFFGEANDIAVSVSSARALPTGREPQPKILEPLADDHMSFFRSETGLKAIADNLLKND